MGNFMEFLYERLREPSTWRGLIAMLTSLGVVLDPDQIELIIPVGVGIIGVIGTFVPDKPIPQNPVVADEPPVYPAPPSAVE